MASVSRTVNWHQVGLFLAITFTLTYALGLILHLGWGYGDNAATGTLLQFQMLIPAAVAIALQLFVFKTSPIYHLRRRPRWFFYVYLGYVALLGLGSAASLARPDWTILASAAIALPLLFVVLLAVLRVASGKDAFRQAGLAGGRLAAFLHALNNNVIAFLFGTVYRPDNPTLAFGWGILGLLVWGVIIAGLLFFWRRWWNEAVVENAGAETREV